MFDWFFEFLLNISRGIFKVIDVLIECANVLCGITDISVNNKTTNFIEFLFSSNPIISGFRVACILGFIVLIFFTIFALLRNIVKEKDSEPAAKTCMKAFKSFLMFLFVPFIMFALISFTNVFMIAINKATINNSNSIGQFMFEAFGQDALISGRSFEGVSYLGDLDDIWKVMEIDEYDFILSWIAGLLVMFTIGSSMLVFVDRAISLVILYIAAPFSISSSVLDDGARFKMWREQVLTKFLVGYGTILAINIYAISVGLVNTDGFHFFKDSSFLDNMCKLLIIIGGAFTMKRSMALIGNLVAQGAGNQELLNSSLVGSPMGLASKVGGAIAGGAKLGFNVARVAAHPKNAYSALKQTIGNAWKFQKDYQRQNFGDEKKGSGGDDGGNDNSYLSDIMNRANGGSSSVKNAIQQGAGGMGDESNQNQQMNNSNNAGSKLSDAINNSQNVPPPNN